jgi:hypothetical protein
MAIACGPNIAFALITNIPAQTPTRYDFNHPTLQCKHGTGLNGAAC